MLAATILPAAAASVPDDAPAGLIPTSATLAAVRALYARTHAHEPSRNATTIEDWRLVADKLVGTYRVYRLGKDERDVTSIGPFIYENGVHGGVRWQQTRNGITYTYSGVHDARDALSERAWETPADARDVRLIGESVTYNAYVVQIDPPGGRREWRFIDKRTGDVVRRESIGKDRRVTALFEDFRIFDGVAQPSRIRVLDSFGNEREQTLLSRTLDLTPDPHDVDIAPTRRSLVEFPLGVTLVHLPVRIVNGLAVTRVRIGSRSYDFLLDSGAAGIVVDPSIVDDQHLDSYGSHVGSTVGTFNETATIVPALALGTLKLRAIVARVVAIPFHLSDGTRIAGLLGFDFFADCAVHVDLDHGVIDAIAPATFKPPADAVAVPLALDDRTPVVRARAGTAFGRMILDTGANRSILSTAFAARADVAYDQGGAPARFRGVGGVGVGEAVHLRSFALGGIEAGDAVVDVSGADLGVEDVDGTIGTDVSHVYDLIFDERSATVWVRRSHRSISAIIAGS